MQKLNLEITGMECPNCAMHLEQLEDKLKGVISVQASYIHSNMKIEFDENVISWDSILKEIHLLGYEIKNSQG